MHRYSPTLRRIIVCQNNASLAIPNYVVIIFSDKMESFLFLRKPPGVE